MRLLRHILLPIVFVLSVVLVGALAWNAGLHSATAGDGTIICGPGGAPIATRAAGVPAGAPAGAPAEASAEGGFLSFFTNGGAYMPRVHCMVNEAGTTDWPWVWALLGLNAVVIAGYARIFIFWRRAYLSEARADRNTKLMDMAWIFLWCAVCGYAASVMMFVWPAYRLVALFLVPLAFFTWRFCANLQEMQVSLSAKRLERELEEALRARTAELEHEVRLRTAELLEARDAARDANEAKSAFVATMSHEVRTPLNAILGYSAMIAEGGLDDEERARLAGVIERNGDHLATVVNDVLDLSKIESRKLTIERIEWSPGEMVTDVALLLMPGACEKGITLSAEVEGTIPSVVLGDPTRARQVLLNLAGNAVKFTERGSVCIVVRATETASGCGLEFEVRDSGIGMTAGQIEKVFLPFSQAEPGTTRRFGGTGLGLTISRHLCGLMGGTLEARSALGSGSVFTARIAVGLDGNAEWVDHLDARLKTANTEQTAEAPVGRVLVVDDSIDNRRLFATLLRNMGHEVVDAADGIEAIEAVERSESFGTPFGLVLMDLDMPRCNGETAMRQIHRIAPRLPVVALTAHTMAGVREKLLSRGFDDYASKPIRKAKLAALCALWLRDSGGDRSSHSAA